MTGRSQRILNRFPAHFEAARTGKQLAVVTDALATNLDEQSAIMARIRRSHRLADAGELRDLLLIAALHGISQAELALLFARFSLAQKLLSDLSTATTPEARDQAAEKLCDLWAIDAPRPRLSLFAVPSVAGGTPDLSVAQTGLIQHGTAAITNDVLLDALRKRIANISRIHVSGNGTIGALLGGAANALDFDIIDVFHHENRFWHAATVQTRFSIVHPVHEPASGSIPAHQVNQPVKPAIELIGLEENPIERISTDQLGRQHTELFSELRRGFERVVLQIQITGKQTFTVGPMLVNRDEGHGVGYARAVPDGSQLVFTEEGRVLLDNSDVTSFAYAWKGACFAGAAGRNTDFVFDGPGVTPERRARFVETTPAGALNFDFVFPHAGKSLPMPGIDIGETRFAFFVQQAHFSNLAEVEGSERLLAVAPRTAVGFLDASVFAAAPGESKPQSALVSLSWLEHRAFVVRLLIPRRFQILATEDDPEGVQVRQRVAQAVKRFQPAGVDVRVEFIDARWILGGAKLISAESDDPITLLRSGTLLWSAPD
jgi:hypothetical protein